MAGFFSSSEVVSKQPIGVLPKCGACKLHKKCNYPKPEVFGRGKKRILIVTDNTSISEDERKRGLVGDTNDLIKKLFAKEGIDIERDCWKTSAVICHSKDKPKAEQADYCYPNLRRVIKEKDPDIIIPMGALALRSILKETWKGDVGEFARWPGWRIPCQNPNAWVCPMYGPRWLLTQREKVAQVWFRRHLKAALALRGKPHPEGPPCYDKAITVITDPTKAAAALKTLLKANKGKAFAFDYEANALKPEVPGFKIYSASVSNGDTTLAFPWRGAVVKTMKHFLLSNDWKKIAANMKYEDRVTRWAFGEGVANWVFDTMLAGHIMDCRQGITGLKFLSLVHLGAPEYNYHIEPFFKGDGGRLNNIHKINTHDLLLYNGIDSLLEYKLAIMQKKEIK